MASFADRTLKCVECGADFTHAASEQELHQSLGYQNEPKRCTPCRDARRQRKGGVVPREFFTALCAGCGREAQLPFKPGGDRPVYCSDCFSKR